MKLSRFLPIFSFIFHPIFISVYGTIFYFLFVPNNISETGQVLTLIQVTILTTLLPLVSHFLLVTLGKVQSFTEATLEERKIPLMIQMVLFFILLEIKNFDDLTELYCFYLGGLIAALLAFVAVLFKYKASLHMIGITSLATFVYCLVYVNELPFIYMVAFTFVCVGLVASSRLHMKSHTVNELILGSFIGCISLFVILNGLYKFYSI